MPRQKRIEFPGALLHVLNRGNYRAPIFQQGRSGEVFENLLFESCERYDWQLHAYTIMSNHYHLALRINSGRLSEGMQWLQSTFANRFNRFVGEPGHVFQGRFKALLIRSESSLLRVVNYIHLNPVRAEIVPLEKLDQYKLSSFAKFLINSRHQCLCCEEWLSALAGLPANRSGMDHYWKYLMSNLEREAEEAESMRRLLKRGWFHGSPEDKADLLQDLPLLKLKFPDIVGLDTEACADNLLKRGLEKLRMTNSDLETANKGAYWKCALSRMLKRKTGVSNRWLATHLQMGHHKSVSRLRRVQPRTPEDLHIEQQLEDLWKCEA